MIYYFDRYLNGVKMAQGARITSACDEKEALNIAKSLFSRQDYDYFTLTNVLVEVETISAICKKNT